MGTTVAFQWDGPRTASLLQLIRSSDYYRTFLFPSPNAPRPRDTWLAARDLCLEYMRAGSWFRSMEKRGLVRKRHGKWQATDKWDAKTSNPVKNRIAILIKRMKEGWYAERMRRGCYGHTHPLDPAWTSFEEIKNGTVRHLFRKEHSYYFLLKELTSHPTREAATAMEEARKREWEEAEGDGVTGDEKKDVDEQRPVKRPRRGAAPDQGSLVQGGDEDGDEEEHERSDGDDLDEEKKDDDEYMGDSTHEEAGEGEEGEAIGAVVRPRPSLPPYGLVYDATSSSKTLGHFRRSDRVRQVIRTHPQTMGESEVEVKVKTLPVLYFYAREENMKWLPRMENSQFCLSEDVRRVLGGDGAGDLVTLIERCGGQVLRSPAEMIVSPGTTLCRIVLDPAPPPVVEGGKRIRQTGVQALLDKVDGLWRKKRTEALARLGSLKKGKKKNQSQMNRNRNRDRKKNAASEGVKQETRVKRETGGSQAGVEIRSEIKAEST